LFYSVINEYFTLSLHVALPISGAHAPGAQALARSGFLFRRSTALLHDLSLVGALLAHGLRVGDERAVDLDPVTVAHLAVGLHQLGVDAQLVAAVEFDVRILFEQARSLDRLPGRRPLGQPNLDQFLA